jgi:hypothetical protein
MKVWNPNCQVFVSHQTPKGDLCEVGNVDFHDLSGDDFCTSWLHAFKKGPVPTHDSCDVLQDSSDHGYFWGRAPPSSELGQFKNLLSVCLKGSLLQPTTGQIWSSGPCSLGTKLTLALVGAATGLTESSGHAPHPPPDNTKYASPERSFIILGVSPFPPSQLPFTHYSPPSLSLRNQSCFSLFLTQRNSTLARALVSPLVRIYWIKSLSKTALLPSPWLAVGVRVIVVSFFQLHMLLLEVPSTRGKRGKSTSSRLQGSEKPERGLIRGSVETRSQPRARLFTSRRRRR